jgi:glycosyltransferase involved in cell wall biosynthesis
MRIGLDGYPLTLEKTGVGHYTFELAQGLTAVSPADEFELVMPSGRRGWWLFGLPRYCQRASLDLFHGTNFAIPLWGRCPSVLTIHDLSLLLHPETHEQRLVRRARRNLPLMARRAAAVITPSAAVKREVCAVLKVPSARVFAIPEAARSFFYRVSPTETAAVRRRFGIENDFLLFVGTIEPRKNLLNLLRAMEELFKTTDLRPQLVIAGGEGWLSEEFNSYLSRMKMKERVVCTGYLRDEDLRALYSSCRVFVYPSLYEGFGLPLLEAMACGAPVVTSNVPSIVETVGDAARLITPTDFKDLAQGIGGLLQDDVEREKRSAAGIEHAKKFTWEKTASATLEVYRDVALRQKAGATKKHKRHK